jgi:uncharacterized membrane protein YdbT with pleckstrin-like domain
MKGDVASPSVASPTTAREDRSEEVLLREVRTSRWHFFWHYVFFFLILPPIVAWWNRAAFVMRIYTNRVVVEKGVLSKDIKEIFCTDIQSIEVTQTVMQRLFGIGSIVIGNAAADWEEEAEGIPDPNGLKELILNQKRTGR